MSEIFSLLTGGSRLFAVAAIACALAGWGVLQVLRQRREPGAMLSWVLAMVLLPGLGVALYYLIGDQKVRRRGRRKRKRSAAIAAALSAAAPSRGELLAWNPSEGSSVPGLDQRIAGLAGISSKLARSPLTGGNRVEVFTCARSIYDDMLRSIGDARNHVHLEYYIFRPDRTGAQFRDALAKKARDGVEVRVLLDGIGCFGTTRRFLRPLIEAGARVETFLPAVPLRQPWHINFRNHRKLLVVDGKIAFTGSQNIGDEYRGRLRRVGPWKDTHLRLEGPAATLLQEVFIEDWHFASGEDLTARRYLPPPTVRGDSLVQIVPTGPDQADGVLAHIFFASISVAERSIRISTPYFVPDPGLIFALENAAHRGIEVELMIPSRTDARLVLWAGRSYYAQLHRAGVAIHEYGHGMLHSKVVCIDDRWSMVGSANMDMRSFLLNFEITVSIFDERISRTLAADFAADRDRSLRIRPAGHGREPFLRSVLEGGARLFAPLL